MNDSVKHKPLAFSGIQPSGKLHLGNYLGAMKNWVRLQDRMPCIYCVVDMHAITVWQAPPALPAACREGTAALLGGGIDPPRPRPVGQWAVGAPVRFGRAVKSAGHVGCV